MCCVKGITYRTLARYSLSLSLSRRNQIHIENEVTASINKRVHRKRAYRINVFDYKRGSARVCVYIYISVELVYTAIEVNILIGFEKSFHKKEMILLESSTSPIYENSQFPSSIKSPLVAPNPSLSHYHHLLLTLP